MSLRGLEPDEEQIKYARYQDLLKPCPFCGASNPMPLDYVNETPLLGKRPVYQSIVACSNTEGCGATTRYNGSSRDEARTKAIARWESRK